MHLVRSRCPPPPHRAHILVGDLSEVKGSVVRTLAALVSVWLALSPIVEEIAQVVDPLVLERLKWVALALMSAKGLANHGSGLNLVENRRSVRRVGHCGVWQC